MGPRDHRIHLGRMDSPKSSPQIHSSTKSCFSGVMFWLKKVPRPKCWPDPSKISPEADFGNFFKSLQQWRTANPREILSRIHPSTLQTEPRGEKLICCTFSCKNCKCGVGNPTFMFYFWDFGPTPGMLGVGHPFSEKMFQKHRFSRFGSRPEFWTGCAGWRQNGTRLAVRTLGSSRAWGQDDGS